MKNNWTNGIMSVIVGDALGNPVQFMSRDKVMQRGLVTGMEAGGVFHMPAGCWTDDGSMTLATLDSILQTGKIDPDDIMKKFIEWDRDGKYTPTGKAYDQGITCTEALYSYRKGKKWDRCGKTGENANGNGALMRIMPVCLFAAYQQFTDGLSDFKAVMMAQHVTLMTHNHLRACTASGLYYFMCRELLRDNDGGSFREILQKGLDAGIRFYQEHDLDDEMGHFARIRDLEALAQIPSEQVRSSGYVIHTIEAALWSLVTEESLPDSLLKAVNLGDDADTVGAVAGGLAGLYYGYEAVPEDWKRALKKRESLEEFCLEADRTFPM
ncbi:MAG: ADP-ribosylglycohydrolase family protein [Eubacteriales bacterium]|nr:ADP-ribosylglycohydrolase family protein [Eubacteriales bacterium]